MDTNECLTNNGGCEHNCVDTDGSYQCSCNAGYQLQNDNHGCEDVDECTDSRTLSYCSGNCVNTVGGYFCTCPDYQELVDGRVTLHTNVIEEKNCRGFPVNHQAQYTSCENRNTNFGLDTCKCMDNAGNEGVVANTGGCLGRQQPTYEKQSLKFRSRKMVYSNPLLCVLGT